MPPAVVTPPAAVAAKGTRKVAIGETVNLLPTVQKDRDVVRGTWEIGKDEVRGAGLHDGAYMQLKALSVGRDASYDLVIKYAQTGARHGIMRQLKVGGENVTIVTNARGGTIDAITFKDRRNHAPDHPARTAAVARPKGTEVTSVVSVKYTDGRASISLVENDVAGPAWEGDATLLGATDVGGVFQGMNDAPCIAFGAVNPENTFVIREIRFTLRGGTAELLDAK